MREVNPDAWPTLRAAVPFEGDEGLFDPSSFANYRSMGGVLTRGAYDEADRAFHEAWTRVRAGSGEPLPTEALRLLSGLTHDTRGPRSSPVVIGDSLLCDLVIDLAPDAVSVAGDRFLGPWADLWRADLQQVAVAASTWWNWVTGPASPLDRYWNTRPRPDLSLRRAAKATGRAPPMLYDPDWRPLLPLHESFSVAPPSHGLPVPLTDGPIAGYVGRLVPLDDGGSMVLCALGLSRLPDVERLQTRLTQELIRLRRHERRSNWETMLRERGEVLYRVCASACWED